MARVRVRVLVVVVVVVAVLVVRIQGGELASGAPCTYLPVCVTLKLSEDITKPPSKRTRSRVRTQAMFTSVVEQRLGSFVSRT